MLIHKFLFRYVFCFASLFSGALRQIPKSGLARLSAARPRAQIHHTAPSWGHIVCLGSQLAPAGQHSSITSSHARHLTLSVKVFLIVVEQRWLAPPALCEALAAAVAWWPCRLFCLPAPAPSTHREAVPQQHDTRNHRGDAAETEVRATNAAVATNAVVGVVGVGVVGVVAVDAILAGLRDWAFRGRALIIWVSSGHCLARRRPIRRVALLSSRVDGLLLF